MEREDIAAEHHDFFDRLMDVGARRYHDKHPFHRRMNAGELSREALRIWAVNRFYYQRTIPLKDGAILSNMPDPAMRRRWIRRILDQDGTSVEDSGLEAWLRLVEAVGGTREQALDDRNVLPGVRFAVDAYLTFARTRPWLDAVASSLTELFAPKLHAVRIEAFPKFYPWVDAEGLRYFKKRLGEARTDVAHGLSLVLEHCRTAEQKDRAVACVEFKCDLLWAQLDAIEKAAGA